MSEENLDLDGENLEDNSGSSEVEKLRTKLAAAEQTNKTLNGKLKKANNRSDWANGIVASRFKKLEEGVSPDYLKTLEGLPIQSRHDNLVLFKKEMAKFASGEEAEAVTEEETETIEEKVTTSSAPVTKARPKQTPMPSAYEQEKDVHIANGTWNSTTHAVLKRKYLGPKG